MYQIIVSYPLGYFPTLDDPIRALAFKYGGIEIGCGAGLGERDWLFDFKSLDRLTTDFIIEVLKLPEVEVNISAIVADPPAAIS